MSERLDHLRQELREDPSSRLFFQLGETLRKEGELEEAAQVLRAGLEHYPRYVGAWVSLGRTLFELSSVAEAEQALATALELDPENPIAARMMGETAMGLGDWLQAIKALKLARVFSPKDEELEAHIAFVEERLTEQGLLEGEPSARPVVADELPVIEEVEDEAAAAVASRPEADASPEAPKASDIFTAGDPFSEMLASGDSGHFKLGADVFGAQAEAAAPEESSGEVDEPAADSAELLEEAVVSTPEQDAYAEAVPMATVTLAQLALDQGDRELARRTLQGLLEREPGHGEAMRMLSDLDADAASATGKPEPAPPTSLPEAKTAALQAWLDTVRLASEVR